MQFLFDNNKNTITSNDYVILGQDIFKIIYYYSFDFFNQEFIPSLKNEDYSIIKNESDKHISDAELMLKLLAALIENKINRKEKQSLINIVLKMFKYESEILSYVEIEDNNAFLEWAIHKSNNN